MGKSLVSATVCDILALHRSLAISQRRASGVPPRHALHTRPGRSHTVHAIKRTHRQRKWQSHLPRLLHARLARAHADAVDGTRIPLHTRSSIGRTSKTCAAKPSGLPLCRLKTVLKPIKRLSSANRTSSANASPAPSPKRKNQISSSPNPPILPKANWSYIKNMASAALKDW